MMDGGVTRSLDISGAFVGHVTNDEDSRALNMRVSATIDPATSSATTVYRSAASNGAEIINHYTDPKKVRVIKYEMECAAKMAAADAYRMAPVTPNPKSKRPEIPSVTCPTCDGRKCFAGEACPECLGKGHVPEKG